MGCPLAATVVDAADNDDLRLHVSELLARWKASVAGIYIKFGDPPAVADEQSRCCSLRSRAPSFSPAPADAAPGA